MLSDLSEQDEHNRAKDKKKQNKKTVKCTFIVSWTTFNNQIMDEWK